MPGRELKFLAAFVGTIAVLQIFFEDLLVFVAATGGTLPPALNSRYAMVAIPLTLMLVLFGVLLGAAMLAADPEDGPPEIDEF